MIPRYDVLTLHPDIVGACVGGSILGRAVAKGVIELGVHDIREHATDRHRTADDTPYGGGAGMVMKVDLVAKALAPVRRDDSYVVLTSPGGTPMSQAVAQRLAALPHLVVVCGHYEGIDARIETLVDEEISLGDFVLTGGEIAAAAIIDATARLQPGVLGNAASAVDESFSDGLLEYPQYTRPASWEGLEVPAVLLSGHHGKVEIWRRHQSMTRTRDRRPDLWRAWCEAHGRAPDDPILIDERRRRK